jgi:hypothetical protein
VLATIAVYSVWDSAPVVPLSDGGPQTDLFQVRDIQGLEPVKASINTTPFGSVDGDSFVGADIPKRNIVLTIGLNPDWADWSMATLRRALYAYFMTKQRVRLVFSSDDDFPDVEISGYVESNEPTIFSKDGEIPISIVCPDPYFTAVEATVVAGIANAAPREVDYIGSIETGLNVKVTSLPGPVPTVIGVQIGDPTVTSFRVDGSVSATKYLSVNTIPGQKYVQNVELGSGLITNLLPKLESGYTWPTLKPGTNLVSVTTNGGQQDWELSYFARFGGL